MSDNGSIRHQVIGVEQAQTTQTGKGHRPAGNNEPAVHVLEECAPAFLSMLDTYPEKAWADFHDFAWKLLRTYPPPVFRDLPPETREDLTADLVIYCRKDEFRVLKRYKNRGVPFAFWLAKIARNRAIDVRRREGHQAPEALQARGRTNPDSGERLDHRELLGLVQFCVSEMSVESRLLLECAADELKPRQIAVLLGLPPGGGKKVSDKLRGCRKDLRRRLEQNGYELELST